MLAKAGSHIRTCPPGETTTRRQRIFPDAAAQVPAVGLVISIDIFPAGVGVTLPRLLKVMADWVAAITAFGEPSVPERD